VAGRGSRLGEVVAKIPKCLVEVNGTPILVNALDRLAAAGIREVVLVIGYLGSAIRERIGARVGPIQIAYRENLEFARTNTTRSLHIGIDTLGGDLLVLEGDVFFEQRVIDAFLSREEPDVTLVDRWRPDLDGSVVTVSADSSVTAWVHKNDRPAGFALDGTYKTVNLHRFSQAFVRGWLRPVLARHVASDGGREPIETVFAEIIRTGGRIHAADVRGAWLEIDDEVDLRAAVVLFGEATHGSR
jgi:NDP-sugar pyrophosphorylase family protein